MEKMGRKWKQWKGKKRKDSRRNGEVVEEMGRKWKKIGRKWKKKEDSRKNGEKVEEKER